MKDNYIHQNRSKMEIAICTIDLSKNQLDNEYTLFESGRIRHFYDQNPFKLNVEKWHTAKELPEEIKVLFLKDCPTEIKEKVQKLLTS